jgi:hypothetical protein
MRNESLGNTGGICREMPIRCTDLLSSQPNTDDAGGLENVKTFIYQLYNEQVCNYSQAYKILSMK